MTTRPPPRATVSAELLRQRLARVPDADLRNQLSALIDSSAALTGQLQRFNFDLLREPAAHERNAEQLWAQVRPELEELWSVLDAYQRDATRIGNTMWSPPTPAVKTAVDSDDVGLNAAGRVDREAGAGGEQPTWTLRRRLREAACATAAVLGNEVTAVQARLPVLRQREGGIDIAHALRRHLAHVASIVGGLVSGIFANLSPFETPDDSDDSDAAVIELEMALQLRGQYHTASRTLADATDRLAKMEVDDWEDTLVAIVEVLQSLIFGPSFAWMRAPDKANLVELHGLFSQLVSPWSTLRRGAAEVAMTALDGFIESLWAINHRRCLLQHDRQALQQAQRDLDVALNDNSFRGRSAIGSVLASLSHLQGRDPALGQLLEQALSPDAEIPKDALRQRINKVLEDVNQCLREP